MGASTPYLWISQGATAAVPLTARALSNGFPRGSAQVNFTVVAGSGTLSAANARTDSNGYATVTLNVTQLATLVQVSACAAPGNAPCTVFYANPVPLAQQKLQPVSGAGQVANGAEFQPVVVRVTDFSSPPNSVLAAPVSFLSTVLRKGGNSAGGGDGETNSGNPAMPVILNVSQTNTTTDVNGLANIVPSTAGFSPPVEVDVLATAGTSAVLDFPLQALPALPGDNTHETNSQPAYHATKRKPLQVSRE